MNFDIIEDYISAIGQFISEVNITTPIDQEQFEGLAKFVVVADELSHEPFFSKDHHDHLYNSTDGSNRHLGSFGHPAFLKSAILPFRKIWMTTEPCNFEKVRDLIYDIFKGKQLIEGYRYWFFEDYTNTLARQIQGIPKVGTYQDILDIWINTQGVHTGKRRAGNRDIGNFTLKDFDEINGLVGRAKFEYEFRMAMVIIGHFYLSFYRILARPTFERLRTLGNSASFEIEAALRFSPYPREADNIRLEDCFWHLDKETDEETFDRLLERQDFDDFEMFFHGYFDARRPALEALIQFETLDDLISCTQGTILTEKPADYRLMCLFTAPGDFNHNGGQVTVFEGKKVLFEERSRFFLNHFYQKLRKAYLDHREKIPERDDKSKWVGNWQGW